MPTPRSFLDLQAMFPDNVVGRCIPARFQDTICSLMSGFAQIS